MSSVCVIQYLNCDRDRSPRLCRFFDSGNTHARDSNQSYNRHTWRLYIVGESFSSNIHHLRLKTFIWDGLYEYFCVYGT